MVSRVDFLKITMIVIVVGLWCTTFNNISAILWWSVLLVKETEGPGENHQPVESH
jgi:hypothetical protein